MQFSNLKSRVLVAVIMGPLILAMAYLGGSYFLAFTAIIANLAFYEFSKMVIKKGAKVQQILGHVFVTLLIANSSQKIRFTDFEHIIVILVILVSFFELFRNRDLPIFNTGTTLFGIIYLGAFIGTAVELREYFVDVNRGGYLFITLLLSIWISDSAAYFTGIAFGKHKLFKRVSPKKSWEGAIGGFVFSIITFVVARLVVLTFLTLEDAIILGVIVGVAGPLGDLFESLLKRDSGVKDSSNIIPGHGGIFDRFDSLIAISPLVYFYVKQFIKA